MASTKRKIGFLILSLLCAAALTFTAALSAGNYKVDAVGGGGIALEYAVSDGIVRRDVRVTVEGGEHGKVTAGEDTSDAQTVAVTGTPRGAKGSLAGVEVVADRNYHVTGYEFPALPVAIDAGNNNIVVVLADGTVWGAGSNAYGQLGLGESVTSVAEFTRIESAPQSVVAVSCGVNYTMLLTESGDLYGVGDTTMGRMGLSVGSGRQSTFQKVDGISNVTKVDCGYNHSAAITENGDLYITGSNSRGQLGVGVALDSQINRFTKVEAMSGVIDVECDMRWTVIVKNDGSVWAAGTNSLGQLGVGAEPDGSFADKNVFTETSVFTDAVAVAAGVYNATVVDKAGDLWTTGSNNGMLNRPTDVNSPFYAKATTGVQNAVAAFNGRSFGMVVDASGALYATGNNGAGQLGLGDYDDRREYTKVEGLGGVTAATCRENFAAIIDESGKVFTVGNNADGQLGNGQSGEGVNQNVFASVTRESVWSDRKITVKGADISKVPVYPYDMTVTPTYEWRLAISASDYDARGNYRRGDVGVTVTNGEQTHGLIGFGDGVMEKTYKAANGEKLPDELQSVEVTEDGYVFMGFEFPARPVDIAGKDNHTTVVLADGSVWSVGLNSYGQLGDGTKDDRSYFVQGKTSASTYIENAVAVACGNYHTAVLLADGSVWSAGNNERGQLGDGTTIENSTYFVQGKMSEDTPIKNAVAVASGNEHTAVLLVDGSVWSVGINEFGQLGDGTQNNRSYFVQGKTSENTPIANAVAVACGYEYTAVVLADGSVWGVGNGSYGQLGDGTIENRTYFVQGKTTENTFIANAVAVASGRDHIAVLLADGSVWSAGSDSAGQLGDGLSGGVLYFVQGKTSENTPIANAVAVACGYAHTVVILADGSVLSTGRNSYGQLGDGTTSDRSYFTQGKTSANTPITNAVAVASGYNYTAVILADGSVMSVGYNNNGQLGDGTKDNKSYFTSTTGESAWADRKVKVYSKSVADVPVDNYNMTVTPLFERVTLTVESEATTYGETRTLKATLSCEYAGANLSGYELTFNCGDTVFGTATTDEHGVATLDITDLLAVGEHTYTAKSQNSVVAYAINVTGSVNAEILPAEITNVSVTPYAGTYDGTAHTAGEYSATTVNEQPATWMFSKDGETFAETMPELTNAGTHTVYYKVTAPNHNVATGSFTVSIDKAEINVSVTPYLGTYDGKVHAAGEYSATTVNDQPATWTFSTDGEAYTETLPEFTNAGIYTVYYKVTAPNHNDVTSSFKLAITKANTVINTSDMETECTYSGQVQIVGGATLNHSETTPTYENNSFTTVAEGNGKVVRITAAETANYLSATATVTLTVHKATVDAPRIADKVYDGEAQTADVPASELYAVTTNAGGVNKGTYEVVLTLTDAANYKWADGVTVGGENDGEATLEFRIAGAENAWETTPSVADVTYGESVSAEYSARFGDVTVEYYDADGVKLTAAPVNAGTYKAVFTVAGTDDYTGLTAEVEFMIAKKAIEVTIEDVGAVYGDGESPLSYAVELDDLVYGDTDSVLNITLTKADGTNVGEYAITGTYNSANYEVTFVNGKYTITPRKITVTIENKTSVYGESFAELMYTTEAGAIVGEDALNVTLTKADGTNVGEYAITGTWNNANYEVTFTDGQYTITKATYDMSGVKFENATVTYNGRSHSLEVTGLPAGVTVTYENNGKTNAGTYTVTAKFSGDADNYELIADMTATLTVNKAKYDMSGVKFDNVTVTYNGESHSLEVTGLPAGVTVTYEGNGQTDAGTYTVTAKFSGNANYEAIADMTATLTIEAEAEKGGCSCGGAITDVTTIVLISVGVLLFGAVFAVKKLRNKKK